jgi:hypothetical protein
MTKLDWLKIAIATSAVLALIAYGSYRMTVSGLLNGP